MNANLIPVSIGELFDKYSILQIKSEKIIDNNKLILINQELNYLKNIINNLNIDLKMIPIIKEINEKLWIIEDQIREKEMKQEFDNEFILLARLVYKTNDKRSQIKNEINILFNSNIIDIKSYSNY
jgi:hypothetical protein